MWRVHCACAGRIRIFRQQQQKWLQRGLRRSLSMHVHLPPRGHVNRLSSRRAPLLSSILFRNCSTHTSPTAVATSSPKAASAVQSPLSLQTYVSSSPQEIFRADYRTPAFSIDHVNLSFQLGLDETVVTARSSITRRDNNNRAMDDHLILDGEQLELLTICINDEPLLDSDYTVSTAALTIPAHVLSRFPASFELTTSVRLLPPRLNLALSGLYVSSTNLLCTQCEAMGFRRITYHLDRPDVLSRYSVYMEGDKASFPTLLSNGNLLTSGDVLSSDTLTPSRHFAQWEDPFPKPSYLFALVAGPLVSLRDTFTTRSGKEVQLGIYSKTSSSSTAASVEKFRHALECLKHAMRWDEAVFELECDLDMYNIVAVDDFNMGAMENKGLNVFHSSYVLADPATATDSDYAGVLNVIGHEYFHNWTGNRITLRDWFQLTLKEGLTVFREQWFSADLTNGHGLQRILDVKNLRNGQFLEDSGPTAHPVRPESYIAMDNFYTSTVYLKGAEVVRMYRSLLGEHGFLRGIALYVSRHDGNSATCEDFLAAMKDANPKSTALDNFGRWYEQAGTPLVTVEHLHLDASTETLVVTFSQQNYDRRSSSSSTPTSGESVYNDTTASLLPPLTIPIQTAVYDKDTGALLQSSLLVLDEHKKTFHLKNVSASSIVLSPLQNFSAPVKLAFPQQTEAELLFLLQHDTDAFSRWECQQRVSSQVILRVASLGDEAAIRQAELPPHFIDSFKKTLLSVKDTALADLGTLAALLAPPSFSSLQQQAHEAVPAMDIALLHQARAKVVHALSVAAEQDLLAVYEALRPTSTTFQFTNEEVGRRSLRNECLRFIAARKYSSSPSSLLAAEEDKEAAKLRVNLTCDQYFLSAGACLTDAEAALTSLLAINHPYAKPFQENALDHFFVTAEDNILLLNKWFAMQAAVDSEDVFDTVVALKATHPSFSMSNPSTARALIGTFSANSLHFHHPSGRGYSWLADCVLELDQLNPQMAARLALPLSQWKRVDPPRQALMRQALYKIAAVGRPAGADADTDTGKGGKNDHPRLSADTYEIVHRSLQQ